MLSGLWDKWYIGLSLKEKEDMNVWFDDGILEWLYGIGEVMMENY